MDEINLGTYQKQRVMSITPLFKLSIETTPIETWNAIQFDPMLLAVLDMNQFNRKLEEKR